MVARPGGGEEWSEVGVEVVEESEGGGMRKLWTCPLTRPTARMGSWGCRACAESS